MESSRFLPFWLLLALAVSQNLEYTPFNLLIICDTDQRDVTTKVIQQVMKDTKQTFSFQILEISATSLYENIADYCATKMNNVSAILDLTTGCQLAELAMASDTPYLSVRVCAGVSSTVTPNTAVYVRAILDILTSRGLDTRQLTIFADRSTDMSELLGGAIVKDTTRIRTLDITQISDDPSSEQIQWAINSKQVGVIGDVERIRTLFEKICKLETIPEDTSWIIVSIGSDFDNCFLCGFNDSMYLRPSHRDAEVVENLIRLDGTSDMTLWYGAYESTVILHQLWRELNKYNISATIEGRDVCREPSPVIDVADLDETDLQFASSFGSVQWTEDGFECQTNIDIGRYSCRDNVSHIEMVGQWTEGVIDFYRNDNLWEPEESLLRILTVPESPFVNRLEHANGSVTYTGYSIDVLAEIVQRLNLRYSITEPADGQFGAVSVDGVWSGMIGEVGRKVCRDSDAFVPSCYCQSRDRGPVYIRQLHSVWESRGFNTVVEHPRQKETADMAIGPISVTAERETVVDFATPYYDFAGIQIMIRRTIHENSMFTFTTVFSTEVWLCWFSVLGATAIFLHAFDRLSHCKCARNPNAPVIQESGFGFKDSCWFVISSLTLSGPEKRPRSFSSRILVTGFWFFCSIMMATYTANLAALLTISRLSAPVANMEDLLSQSQIKYSTKDGTSMQTYFKRMAEIEANFYEIWKEMSYGNDTESSKRSHYAVWDYPLPDKFKVIWQNMEDTGFVNSSEKAIERVLGGDFAYFTEAPIIKYKMSQHCQLTAVGPQFSAKPYAFAFQEKSPLTAIVSSVILELQQERILETLKQKWWPEVTSKCGGADGSDGVDLVEMAGIFMLVGGGVICGLLTLTVELICYRFVERSKKQKNNNADGSNLSMGDRKEGSRTTLELSDMENIKEMT